MTADHLFDNLRLTLTSLRLVGRVDRPIIWNSYPGSVIHGVLGMKLKLLNCVKADGICEGCPYIADCPYGLFLESPRPPDADRMKLYPHVPSPLRVVFKPWAEPTLEAGRQVTLGIVLVGKARRFTSTLLYALGEAFAEGIGRKGVDGLRGTIQIDAVEDGITHESISWGKWRFDQEPPFAEVHWGDLASATSDLNSISFTTPTRIVSNGKIMREPKLRDVLSTAMRRVSSLAYFHCGVELNADYKGLLELAEQVEHRGNYQRMNIERFSGRQRARMNTDGILGRLQFDSIPGEIIPWLRLATRFGIGKGTTMGMGECEISP